MLEVIQQYQTQDLPPMQDPKEYVDNNQEFLKEFLKFAKAQKDSVGLAGNQCKDVTDRVLAVKINGWKIAVDPYISKVMGERTKKKEHCLSWKGKYIVASRHDEVEVTYYDINGKLVTERDSGFNAQIWQHEINHLNGVKEDVINVTAPIVNETKTRPNEPCPCGSGNKFKKCCK
jgi:peptide deformylase